ncbi:hypothetical protein [Paenibacillus sp. NEAU-GSW1]|nr:hypothetical protein [Paenibacillus sp. NEAU-GSW1]MUT65230.1 hypothetical protein [Paenibacillus sp. NEAU-GSW1]
MKRNRTSELLNDARAKEIDLHPLNEHRYSAADNVILHGDYCFAMEG